MNLADLNVSTRSVAISPSGVTAGFACLLYLARHHPVAEDEFAEATRVFLVALGEGPVTVEVSPDRLSVDGRRVPPDSPGAREVNEHLLSHSIGGVTFPAAPDPADLHTLARVLAVYPGQFATWEDLITSLGPVAERIVLVRAGTDLPFIRFEETGPLVLESRGSIEFLASIADPGKDRPGTDPPVPLLLDQQPRYPGGVIAAQPVHRTEDPKILERLIVQGRSAADAGDHLALLRTARGFLDAEDKASSESMGRLYQMELRRILTRGHIAQFARLAALGAHRELGIGVLSRLGPDATEVLMEQLIEADTMAERRGYYSALMRMDDGRDIIIYHLEHPRWYVVRNAAELAGEMGLAEAIPRLARLTAHPDERVRKSVATALARIGSPEVGEPLGRMLKDPSPAIRQQVLDGLKGFWARPLAMPLAALLETEEHPDVLRELLQALGRIGTPDALLALRRVALGEIGRAGRRYRVRAVEALAQAGDASTTVLQALARDGEARVAQAAFQALARLAP